MTKQGKKDLKFAKDSMMRMRKELVDGSCSHEWVFDGRFSNENPSKFEFYSARIFVVSWAMYHCKKCCEIKKVKL